ncbi:F-box/kelch-repeat protein At1g57790 [Linum perenne]
MVKHPFLVRFQFNSSYTRSHWQLYLPAYNKRYRIDAPPCIRKDTEIHCCKHGWLLLSRGEHFFFYHPSTGQVLKLPDLLTGDCFSLNRMSFSAPPTSPGCVIFGIVDMFHHVSAYICFLRRGDTDWTHYNGHRGFLHYTKRNFSNNPRFAGIRMPLIPCKGAFKTSNFSSTPVFHNGGFYFIDLDGVLGVFNPRAKKRRNMWRILNHGRSWHSPKTPSVKPTSRSRVRVS